jgi:VWFA-related protein
MPAFRTSRSSRRLIGYGALLVTLAWAAHSFARQPQAQPPPPPPVFHTEANYVRVDAYPTKGDEPIPDLTAADFEILENGVPQRIDQFERVVIRGAGPQDVRIEPNTVRESRSMAESSRARVFVLFLDFYHVEVDASRNIRDPLVRALDKLIGVDDMVGVMTPEMSPTDITFARKTTTIDGILSRYWHWGEREKINLTDPEDKEYGMCYPNVSSGDRCADQNGIAQAMIDRRHEKRTIDSLQDLVRFLRGVREERKAILAISDGWLLFRPDSSLARALNCEKPPTGPPIQIDPRTGKLGTKEIVTPGGAPQSKCGRDRLLLSEIDDEREFREVLDEANRANASFYPIDPRGLVVFDDPMLRQQVPGAPPTMTSIFVDSAHLTARLTALRTLAEATDGLAIVNTNDLNRGLARVVNDLSSYYLLGYYSTGKLDGKFHAITVRVKRPGVRVRARRGYLAATPAAVTTSNTAPTAPAKEESEARALEAVLSPLNGSSRDVPIKLWAASGWKPGNVGTIWMVGELGSGEDWKNGAETDLMVTSASGDTIATGHLTVPPGARSFRAALRPSAPLAPGDYVLRVRARSTASGAAVTESVPAMLAAAPASTGALLVRRGPLTGNRDTPTADARFHRNEQIRVEMPTPEGNAVTARLLDRTGKPLAIPLTTAAREDEDGTRWVTTQLALAPLAVGDYVIELSGPARTLVAFRIVP